MTKVPFSFQAVLDGHWEFYHDDSCGAVLDPDTKVCSSCGWRPDMQSMGARRVKELPAELASEVCDKFFSGDGCPECEEAIRLYETAESLS